MENPFRAVKYLIDDDGTCTYLELRDFQKDLWAITQSQNVWNYNKNQWEYEPLPSTRSAEFKKETRADFDFAVDTAIQLFKTEAVLS